MKTTTVLLLLFSVWFSCLAQSPTSESQQFIRVEAPVIAPTLDLKSPAVQDTIRTLVAKNVAVTSTLPVFEAGAPLISSQMGIGAATAVLNPRVLNIMNTDAHVRYLTARSRIASDSMKDEG
jgi:hypothetical protein